ncbi:GTP cyclohydrolase [Marinilabiliaceae bacterium JC017]|nr:GTP cyclohydrolase [Marinilabiliaceae bacterium JC017]
MYIVSLTYKVPNDVVDEYLEAHVEFLKEQYHKGHFLASGRKVPRSGGVILSGIESIEALNQVINQDPFKQNGVADYEIIEFIPSMTCAELDFLRTT